MISDGRQRGSAMKTFREKRFFPFVCITAAVCIIAVLIIFNYYRSIHVPKEHLRIGMICDGDQGTPYTENFYRALKAVQEEYKGKVTVDTRSNVSVYEAEKLIRELVSKKTDMIITNSFGYGEIAKKMAGEYPDVEFIQATQVNANEEPFYDNYHTFMGRIYEGRYIAGQVAGRKMQEMIDTGVISEDEAIAGYVAAYPYAEVISGYTAFFLGMRDQCPSAVMKVKYSNTWTSYQDEYDLAKELIKEGAVIISQHSDTTGPAVACEEYSAASGSKVYSVGYNKNMIDVAPTTSLISTKINWTPYLKAAVGAMLDGKKIESAVDARIHGNDAGAGFDKDWVRMLSLNDAVAAKGTQQMIEKSIALFKKGDIHVFSGNYRGSDPNDPSDTIDLSKTEYIENKDSSAPTFHYVIDGITIE